MPELLVDFITSLDGYAAADGWPGWWGLQGPEYLAWLGEQPEVDYTVLMGATTYRLMSRFAAENEPGTDALAGMSKIVFSTTLSEPLAWANTQLVARDAVEAVREMKAEGTKSMRTIGSLTLCRVLLEGRSGGPLPGGCLSRRHWKQRPGADLRRVSRCCSRHDQQPHVRRSHPTARVRSDDSVRTAGHKHGQGLTPDARQRRPGAISEAVADQRLGGRAITGEAYGASPRIQRGSHVDERLLCGCERPIRSPGQHDDARRDDAGKGRQLHALVGAEARPELRQNRNAETCSHHFLDCRRCRLIERRCWARRVGRRGSRQARLRCGRCGRRSAVGRAADRESRSAWAVEPPRLETRTNSSRTSSR